MPNYEPGRGKTLLIPSGTDNDPNRRHLFVVLTNPCAEGQVLLVSLSSVRDGVHHDPACIFEAGEHEFVRQRSFAAYRLARIERADHISRCVDGWLFTPRDAMDDALVQRMCEGLMLSDFAPVRIIRYYEANIP